MASIKCQTTARINDVLHVIHRDISADLSGKRLAEIAAYSEQHFHRVFLKIVGENVHQYVRRTRLEQAANQLMFDAERPVADIADACGFASLSSFGKAFTVLFGTTPGAWRKQDKSVQTPPYMKEPEIARAYQKISSQILPLAELVELPSQSVAYVRHQGYDRSIRFAWQTLKAWASTEKRGFKKQIGLHHSNPSWVPLNDCRYVACLVIDRPLGRRGVVNGMTIPGGLHAAFEFSGRYGELLPYISKIQDQWLPESGFRAKSTPALVHYHQNHFLDADECFKLTYYLPISFY